MSDDLCGYLTPTYFQENEFELVLNNKFFAHFCSFRN